jgi:hypothetical protein
VPQTSCVMRLDLLGCAFDLLMIMIRVVLQLIIKSQHCNTIGPTQAD